MTGRWSWGYAAARTRAIKRPRGVSILRPAGSEAPASLPRPLASMCRAWPCCSYRSARRERSRGKCGRGRESTSRRTRSAHQYAIPRRDPDEREDHATAIPGELGILPMPRGPPFSALFALAQPQTGLVRSATSDSRAFARVATEEASRCSGPGEPRRPLRLQQSVDHHPDHGQVAGGRVGRRQQFADAARQSAAPHDGATEAARYRRIGRFQPTRPCGTSLRPGDRSRAGRVRGPAPTGTAFAHAWVRAPPPRASGGGHRRTAPHR